MGAGFLDGEIHVVVPQIANGDGFVVAKFEESIVDLVATIP